MTNSNTLLSGQSCIYPYSYDLTERQVRPLDHIFETVHYFTSILHLKAIVSALLKPKMKQILETLISH